MSELPQEPELDPETVQEMLKGVEEFNAGRYFECHDTLEEIWRGTRGPARNFFQGLIQVSVGFYHLNNGNLPGGRSQLEKGLINLSGYGDRYLGMELALLRREVRDWLDGTCMGEGPAVAGATRPKFHFMPPTGSN